MEKLIELLNKYDEGGNWRKLHWIGLGCEDHDTIGYKDKELSCEQDEIIAYLISKKYGFVNRLVDNDKIDRKKLEIRPFSDELVYSDSDCTVYRSDTTYEMLLMLLAISDTPIDDLISYLK